MLKVVYFSVTGQTRRFVKKLESDNTYEIDGIDPEHEVNEPFVLVVPSYSDDAITEPVDEFLSYGSNAKNLKGIVGNGNRNFAELFIITAKRLAKKYHAPIIYAFEFNGTPRDVSNFKKAVKKIES